MYNYPVNSNFSFGSNNAYFSQIPYSNNCGYQCQPCCSKCCQCNPSCPTEQSPVACCKQTCECYKQCVPYEQADVILSDLGASFSSQVNIGKQVYANLDILINNLTNQRNVIVTQLQQLTPQYNVAKTNYENCIKSCEASTTNWCDKCTGYCVQCDNLKNLFFALQSKYITANAQLEELDFQLLLLKNVQNETKIRYDAQTKKGNDLTNASIPFARDYDLCVYNCSQA